MKILLLHNDYAKYSGEEAVVDKMANMFQAMGHEICFYRPSSKGRRESLIGQIQGFLSGIYSREGVRTLRDILRKEKPDLVNAHNLFPFISPAALAECRKANIPVVMTAHNYRLMCPTGLFMKNGVPCELCLKNNNEWNCIRYNCEHSFLKSLGYALRNMFARKMRYYHECVDTFVCLTEFQKSKLIAAGFNSEKIKVIPNSIDVIHPNEHELGTYVAYAGRLSKEKGVDLLLEVARKLPEIPFHFAGAQRNPKSENLPDNVYFRGHLSKTELENFIKKSRFMVFPSRFYEGFPISILEAMVQGKTMICSNHGAYPEIIGHDECAIGVLFSPGDVEKLKQAILRLWNHPEESERLGCKAHEKVKREYDSDLIFKNWEQLFKKHVSSQKNSH